MNGAGVIVSGASDPLGLNKLERVYSFDVAPVTLRNTFAAGFLLSLDRPAYYFSSGTIAANKILELAVERQVNDVRFEGFNNADDNNYPELISCQWWGNALDPAQLDSGAEIGLEAYTYDQAPPFPNPSSTGVIQLAQRLNDKTQWVLRACCGDGATATQSVTFTVPATPPGEGHRVALFRHPGDFSIRAIVDGQERASLSGAAVYPHTVNDLLVATNVVPVGLFLKTGASVGVGTTLFASWTAVHVVNYGTAGGGF